MKKGRFNHIFFLFLFLFIFSLFLLSCPGPGPEPEEGTFTINFGSSTGRAAYPPNIPPGANDDPAAPVIDDLRFEVLFTGLNGSKNETFTFIGDVPLRNTVAVGSYTITIKVYLLADDSLYAEGVAIHNPITIVSGPNPDIDVQMYSADEELIYNTRNPPGNGGVPGNGGTPPPPPRPVVSMAVLQHPQQPSYQYAYTNLNGVIVEITYDDGEVEEVTINDGNRDMFATDPERLNYSFHEYGSQLISIQLFHNNDLNKTAGALITLWAVLPLDSAHVTIEEIYEDTISYIFEDNLSLIGNYHSSAVIFPTAPTQWPLPIISGLFHFQLDITTMKFTTPSASEHTIFENDIFLDVQTIHEIVSIDHLRGTLRTFSSSEDAAAIDWTWEFFDRPVWDDILLEVTYSNGTEIPRSLRSWYQANNQNGKVNIIGPTSLAVPNPVVQIQYYGVSVNIPLNVVP